MENAEVKALRTLIERFLNERLQTKIKKLQPDDPKWDELHQRHLREIWLANAVQRVSALQLATHVIKATHTAIKGATSLYCPPASLRKHPEVGSHILSHAFPEDVTVTNAAHLDVYTFLKLEHGGVTLLSRVLEGDEELAAAFSDDQDQGREWMQAFAAIARPRDTEASHTLAKQVYWLVGEDPTRNQDFHLLAPLYATSLAHRVYQTINKHRFADEA
ncbi:type I-F CRISPR-associated protein Csy1, partial [Thioalkalivibrio sp.]|uniref:type I-F CRISPR-associated protein Csy1 n=1 Tax=Thioalkalivibrio sp. TaxID=2093813 RepID=UPI003974FD10